MKLSTKQLRSALSECGRAIKGRSTIPAVQCVKLSITDDDRLQLEATNLDAWITRRIDCAEGIEPVMVSYRKLVDVLANVTNEIVNLTCNGSKLVIQGEGSTGVVSLNTLPVDSFPLNVNVNNFKPLAVPSSDLADGIEAVASLADDDDRTNCVMVSLKAKSLTCAASTRSIMWGIFSRGIICEDRSFVLPKELACIIVDDLRGKNSVVSMNERMISATCATGSSAIKLSEKPALAFERFQTVRVGLKGVALDREALRRGCRYAMMFTPEAVGPAVLVERKGNDDEVRVFTQGSDDNSEERLDAPGVPLRFKLNAQLLGACLDKTLADEVLVMQKPDTNAVFFEAGDLLFVLAEMDFGMK